MKRANQKIFRVFFLLATLIVGQKLFAQVQFVENKGQWGPDVQFMSNAGSGSFYLTKKGFSITQFNPEDVENIKVRRHEPTLKGSTANRDAKDTLRSDSYSVEFLNAATPEIIPDKAVPSVNNYFIGNDPSKWASNCKIYLGVTYKNIYPNIDLRYYTDGAGHLKYDFIINPGAKIENKAMKYRGAKSLTIKDKELHVATRLGVNRELRPYTYQVINNQKQ
ncbi:MAG: hypothetical protein ABI359_06290, partial [Ginsengibacter sp.]